MKDLKDKLKQVVSQATAINGREVSWDMKLFNAWHETTQTVRLSSHFT